MKEYPNKLETIVRYDKQAWLQLEKTRKQKAESLGLRSKEGQDLWYVIDPLSLSLISGIEQQRGFLDSLHLPKSYQQALHKKALHREAYYSSHIEGAVTSLEDALLQLNSHKHNYPDESMQMIYNNKLALEFILQTKKQPITHQMICEMHKILVYNTHKDKPITVGAYRHGAVYVVDSLGRVVYEGPPSDQVQQLMTDFLDWLNAEKTLHPLIVAALAHLYFVHVHPFDDGNGRSARALSNLLLEKAGYKFINFLAPSDYFDHSRSGYYRSIQDSREHDYDTTYFIIYYLQALADQLTKVKAEIAKEQKVGTIKELLKQSVYVQLNKRQIKVLGQLLKTGEPLTTRKYCKINKCSDETARKDFNHLLELKIIRSLDQGRSVKYVLSTEDNLNDNKV